MLTMRHPFLQHRPASPRLHARRARAARLARAQSGSPADVKEELGHGPVGWIRSVASRLDRSRSLGISAEMAFWLFLSLLPLAAVAGLITAKLASGNWSATAPLLESLPLATRELIATELGKVAAWNGGKVGIGAGLMFVWLASSGIHSIFDGLEIESDAAPRPWWRKRLLALATCVALSLGVALLTVLGTGLGWLWKFVGGSTLLETLALESSVVGHVVRLLVGAAVSFGLVSGLYWISLPPGTRKSMPIAPGALLAIGLQIILGFGYGFYITKAGDGGAYQGALASIGVTLTALWLFCLVLLVGIKVNEMLGERRRALAAAR